MINYIMDIECAEKLGVDIETYIDKIEKTTYKRAELIIRTLMSEDKKKIIKARKVFNLIR